jgi:hypothetical protein
MVLPLPSCLVIGSIPLIPLSSPVAALSKIEGLEKLTQLRALYELLLSFDILCFILLPDPSSHSVFSYLQENCISQIEGLDTLTEVSQLNLANNWLTSLSGLSKLTKLNTLNVGHNKLSKIEEIKDLSVFEHLRFCFVFFRCSRARANC